MKLRLLLPTRVLLDREVDKVNAEDVGGVFCLLPRHVDFVAVLVPGILSFVTPAGETEHVGIDVGALVKVGDEVLVSTRRAHYGPALGDLLERVDAEFKQLSERERRARSAAARLETGLVRRFLSIQEQTNP